VSAFLHWLNTELWSPMWPNIFAPSASTLAAVVISHIKAARQRQRHHEDMKQHVTNAMGGGGG
jgi:hypothetical protein